MGKLILLSLIIFGSYWAWKAYVAGKNEHTLPSTGNFEGIDSLKNFYEKQIQEIENKSKEEMLKHEGLLNYYKYELEKINQIKQNKK